MVRTRRQTAADSAALGHQINALEHPSVIDYVGRGRYLQVAVSKAFTRLYVTRFGPITFKKLSNLAAGDGFLNLLLWARSIECLWDGSVFLSACENGHIHILEYLHSSDCARPDVWRCCKSW